MMQVGETLTYPHLDINIVPSTAKPALTSKILILFFSERTLKIANLQLKKGHHCLADLASV